MNQSTSSLNRLVFSNRFSSALPADPDTSNTRRQVKDACFSRVAPTPVTAPQVIAYSSEVASILDLEPADCAAAEFAEVFSGNKVLKGMDPHATCYGGHQFGNWAGQLGDGRAINLGEIRNHKDEHWMLQLKGAGPTPYSRTADGRAVLRSSLREFVCSEAMFHLGVPTTRALSLMTTGDEVVRDMLYDGNAAPEPGAVVCRVAESFTRFGHFEMLAARGEQELLQQFANFTIAQNFPHLLTAPGTFTQETYLKWFEAVCSSTMNLMVHWLRVGFVHGVMNTDNLSILGQTIDYGPYGWLEDYDPDWTPNTTDASNKRYRYGQQASVAHWNLLQLANAIFPLIGAAEPLEAILNAVPAAFTTAWNNTRAVKLGLLEYRSVQDLALLDDLENLLVMRETDMTLFYRALAKVEVSSDLDQRELFADCYYSDQGQSEQQQALAQWLGRYQQRLGEQQDSQVRREQRMAQVNPLYVPRNYLAQLAIDAVEAGDIGAVDRWLDVLRNPYTEQPGQEAYAAKRPEWARTRAGCSMLSCSS